MPELFANGAASTLASVISDSDLSLTLATGEGALFPSPTGGDYFHATITNGSDLEIVRVTARSSDTLTIVRAQQSTSAAAFALGASVQIRLTAEALTRFETAALSGGGDPRFYEVTGFVTDSGTPSNGRGYTTGDVDPTTASGQLTVCVIARPGSTGYNTAPRFVFGTLQRSGGSFIGGWGIIWDSGWKFVYVDNSATQRVSSQYEPQTVNKFSILHFRISNYGIGSALGISILANGFSVGEFYGGTDGGTMTAGGNLCLGSPDEGAHDASQLIAFDGFIHGAGYINSTFLSEAQIAEHVIECQEAGQLVDYSGAAFTDGWRVDDTTGLILQSFKAGADMDALNTTALTPAQKPLPIIYY